MKLIAFDTETTGLIENRTLRLERQVSVIEFSACEFDVDTGEEIRWLDTLVRPPSKIPDVITGRVGITNEMVKDAPSFSEIADDVVSFLSSAELLVAHNLSFDKNMIEVELERLGKKIEWPVGICSIEQTMGIKGRRMNLSELHEEMCGSSFPGAHRARVDVEALIRCCLELRRREMI